MRIVCTGIAAVVIGMLVFAACGGAQTGRTRVEYDVEFSTTGPLLDPNCTATGTDVLTGTLVGLEPPPSG